MRPDAIVEWRGADYDDLRESFCLHALVDAKSDELGYIGKAYRSDIATRLKCRSKASVFRHLSRAIDLSEISGRLGVR